MPPFYNAQHPRLQSREAGYGREGEDALKKKKSPEMLGTKWNYCIWTKLLTERPFKIK